MNHTKSHKSKMKISFKRFLAGILSVGVILTGTFSNSSVMAASEKAVIKTYADIAEATFEDALITARVLQQAIQKLAQKPTETNLEKAKTAWLAARVPYQQTEAYRFGNAIVDDWEGKVNAWPLDE